MRDLTEVIKMMMTNEMRDLNFCMQATVVGVDKINDGFIDVAPVINKYVPSIGYIEYGVIYDVPICSLSTITSTIHVPVNQGDDVLLVFSQNDMSGFIEGNRDYQEPVTNSLLSLNNAVAIIGVNIYQDSPFNPRNYKNTFDPKALNIVHNKETDNEITLSLKEDGVFNIKTSNKVEVDAPEIDAKNAVVKTQNDVLIKGKSVYTFMTKHVHAGVQSGSSSTAPPTPQ